MSFTTQETPKIVAPKWDSLITGVAVGVVAGIGVGVIATSKDVVTSIASAAAGAGAGAAVAYFVADYRHTDRRNELHTQIDRATADRNQFDQQLQNATATIAQLQTQVQAAQDRYEQLVSVADTEIGQLKAELATATIAAQTAPEAATITAEAMTPQPPVDALQTAATPA